MPLFRERDPTTAVIPPAPRVELAGQDEWPWPDPAAFSVSVTQFERRCRERAERRRAARRAARYPAP